VARGELGVKTGKGFYEHAAKGEEKAYETILMAKDVATLDTQILDTGAIFNIDPAAVSAPLITTLVDATGLAIYLGIAKITLGL